MADSKKSSQKKKAARTLRSTTSKIATRRKQAAKRLLAPAVLVTAWKKDLKPLSPHRSFRRTYKRDYERSLQLPGYIAFTADVWRVLWRFKATFAVLVFIYASLSALLIGLASQATYSQVSDLLRTSGSGVLSGNVQQLREAGALLFVGASGGFTNELTEADQLKVGFLGIMAWLVTVWMLRAFLAGQKPKLRDGIYNAGAPLVPTLLLSILLIAQLIPAALATIGIAAALPAGILNEGIEAMLFWVAVILLFVLSLYWVVSTLIALVVVTLPGMYPLRALKAAHELVVGRRLRIVLRVVWLFFVTLIVWGLVMIPVIIFDAWAKGVLPAIAWLPLVPVALSLVGSASVIWVASYIYVLYRRIVDDDAAPA